MCSRRLGPIYCDYARSYRGYQVDPPVLTYEGPEVATEDQPATLRFNVSKLSAVEVKVTHPTASVVFEPARDLPARRPARSPGRRAAPGCSP